jgi:radial spoke head protein 9
MDARLTDTSFISNQEPNGTWGVTYDTFKRLAVVRSFAWPGYFAYYSDVSNTTGGIYFGDGRKNEDVAFTV